MQMGQKMSTEPWDVSLRLGQAEPAVLQILGRAQPSSGPVSHSWSRDAQCHGTAVLRPSAVPAGGTRDAQPHARLFWAGPHLQSPHGTQQGHRDTAKRGEREAGNQKDAPPDPETQPWDTTPAQLLVSSRKSQGYLAPNQGLHHQRSPCSSSQTRGMPPTRLQVPSPGLSRSHYGNASPPGLPTLRPLCTLWTDGDIRAPQPAPTGRIPPGRR